MYLDFEDHRPETPRVPSAISRREGVLLSLVIHAACLVGVLFFPTWLPAREAEAVLTPERPPVRFVQMSPAVDRLAPPRLLAEQSDMDRRSATRERAPKPDNAMPFSRGTTPEKTEGAPEEKAAGPEAPQPAVVSNAARSEVATKVIPDAPVVPPRPAGGSLGQALRNLERYLQDQNFENRRGGLTDQDPDIQFDAKGVEFGPWLRRFVAQVKRNWYVPQSAMSIPGRVVIQFYVLRDGTLLGLQVVQPAGIDAFNTSAFNALKNSNPTMPLPPEYPTDRVFFTVTFHYNDGVRR